MHNDLSACPFPQADFLLNDGQKVWFFPFTSHDVQFTSHDAQFTSRTIHVTWYTVHVTWYTVHVTWFTVHVTWLYSLDFKHLYSHLIVLYIARHHEYIRVHFSLLVVYFCTLLLLLLLLLFVCFWQLLSSGQSYRIALEMEVPENQVNLEAGLFMVNITFYSTNKKFLSTSARPVSRDEKLPSLF